MTMNFWYLSQQHLTLLATCPRKFQHIFLEQLTSPVDPQQQALNRWGSRLHKILQQREKQLPIDKILPADPAMARSVEALLATVPELDDTSPPTCQLRQAEHQRVLPWGNFLFTAIYDLLIFKENEAKIIDWKTSFAPQQTQRLKNRWQTKLYLFLLAETTSYQPEQISMTYWFVGKQPNASPETSLSPESVVFAYNATWHEQIRQQLTTLLDQLTQWWQAYQQQDRDFPQVDREAGWCDRCQFAQRCQRNISNHLSPDIASIPEIPL
jgi:hypothetical protein